LLGIEPRQLGFTTCSLVTIKSIALLYAESALFGDNIYLEHSRMPLFLIKQ
jgi:hypothetical protein